MIFCRTANQAVNLHYGAIKFLEFHDFIWNSGAMPLEISPLGVEHQVEVKLETMAGERVDADWTDDWLLADFRANQRYKLKLRLEYGAPWHQGWYAADFGSIVPMSYQSSLDFVWHEGMTPPVKANLMLDEKTSSFSLDEPFERRSLDQMDVWLVEQAGHFNFGVAHESESPFSNRRFPALSVA